MYPEVFHSYRLYQLWDEKPSVPYQPMPPEKPKFHMRGETSVLVFCMSLLGLIVMPIVVIVGIAGGEDIPSELWLIILMSLVIAVACLVYNHFMYQKPLQEEYESKLRDYHSLCKTINQERDRILSADNVKAYRESLVRKWLSGRENGVSVIPGFKKYDDSDDVKVGKSEMAFYNLIKSNLPYTVRKDIKVPVAQTYYYPDIVVIARGLFIDIEIDEPYTDDDGKPIHYLDTSSDEWESVDMRRNRFMSKEGWEIIRFAEEQVVKYPQECVAFINNVIDALVKSGSQPKLVFPYPVDEWTKSEAEHYALVRYRDSYYAEHTDCLQNENINRKRHEYDAFISWFGRQKKYSHNSRLLHPYGWNCIHYEIMIKGWDENNVEGDYPFMVWHHSYACRCEDVHLLELHYEGLDNYCDYYSVQEDGTLKIHTTPLYDKNKKQCKYVEVCRQRSAADLTPVFDKFLSIIEGISSNVLVLFAESRDDNNIADYDYRLDYLREELCKKGIQLRELEFDTYSFAEQQDVVIIEYLTDSAHLKANCEKIFNEFRAKSPCITYLSVFKSCSQTEMMALKSK